MPLLWREEIVKKAYHGLKEALLQLDELVENISFNRETHECIQPFDINILREAFLLKEAAPVDLPPVRKLVPLCF